MDGKLTQGANAPSLSALALTKPKATLILDAADWQILEDHVFAFCTHANACRTSGQRAIVSGFLLGFAAAGAGMLGLDLFGPMGSDPNPFIGWAIWAVMTGLFAAATYPTFTRIVGQNTDEIVPAALVATMSKLPTLSAAGRHAIKTFLRECSNPTFDDLAQKAHSVGSSMKIKPARPAVQRADDKRKTAA